MAWEMGFMTLSVHLQTQTNSNNSPTACVCPGFTVININWPPLFHLASPHLISSGTSGPIPLVDPGNWFWFVCSCALTVGNGVRSMEKSTRVCQID
jgi:hypothetical protein